MRIITFLLLLVMTCLFISSCFHSKNSCSFNINPEVSCRLCDKKSDETKLIESFDADSNELRLFLVTSKQEIEIEHPVGKVANFSDKIKSNIIQFDSTNSQDLIVNGQRFPIVKKE